MIEVYFDNEKLPNDNEGYAIIRVPLIISSIDEDITDEDDDEFMTHTIFEIYLDQNLPYLGHVNISENQIHNLAYNNPSPPYPTSILRIRDLNMISNYGTMFTNMTTLITLRKKIEVTNEQQVSYIDSSGQVKTGKIEKYGVNGDLCLKDGNGYARMLKYVIIL